MNNLAPNAFGGVSGGDAFGADPISSFGTNNQGFGQSAGVFDPGTLQIGLGGNFSMGGDVAPGKYSILDEFGKEAGVGYKPWDQAIADLAYSNGRTGSPGAWSHKALAPEDLGGGGWNGFFGSSVDETGSPIGGGSGGDVSTPTYATEEELKAALQARGDLSFDVLEKYHRAATPMQKSEIIGQLLADPNMYKIPDWTYHRDLGVHNQTPESMVGENAFYGGSQPVFQNGELIGHQVDVAPMSGFENHNDYIDSNAMGGKDAKGAVTSGSYLWRKYNDLAGSAYDMGSGKIFVPIDKESTFPGWTNEDTSYYHKASNGGLGGILGKLAPIALSFALGPAGVGALPAWGAGAVGGAFGSAVNGGNIFKGAALGGLGGLAGGELFGGGGGGGGDIMSSMQDFIGPSMEMMGPSFELANDFVGPSLDMGGQLGSIPAEGFNAGLQDYVSSAGLPDVANATPYMVPDGNTIPGSVYEDLTTPFKVAEKLYTEGAKTPLAKNLGKAYKLGKFGKDLYDRATYEPKDQIEGGLAALTSSEDDEDKPTKSTSHKSRKKVNSSFGNTFGRNYG
jgi:hypothetical protein